MEENMKKKECTICGYIYDPQKGSKEDMVAPETDFNDLSPDWVCPVCGGEKEVFVDVKEQE